MSVSALSRNIFSPQRTGVECPTPGRLVFQLMSFSVHWAGIVVASLSPLPFGPRKRDHSWAEAEMEQQIRRPVSDRTAKNRITNFLKAGAGEAGG